MVVVENTKGDSRVGMDSVREGGPCGSWLSKGTVNVIFELLQGNTIDR